MKKASSFILSLLVSVSTFAQRTPTHNFDFEYVKGDTTNIVWDNFYQFFDSWQPGEPPLGLSKIDDEFFISRQRPLPRITDGDYQVWQEVPAGRKMLMWTPADDPTATWKSLPRYCFEGDNFSMWSYINCHGNWTAPWIRVSAGIADAAAKNGVTIGCVMAIPWEARVTAAADNVYSNTFKKLTEKDDNGNYLHSLKLAKLMKYYGINGLGVNAEFTSNSSTMKKIIGFLADVHHKADSIGWKFEVQWYDLTKDDGTIAGDRGLGSSNQKIFGTGDNIVVDQLFANYNWTPALLEASANMARRLNRDPYDYYAGFDIQGRGLKNDNWAGLLDCEASIGFWGAHSQSLIHQSATDDGTSDVAIQKAYLKKQEMIFSGGNRNPQAIPAIRTDCSLSNKSLEKFHGLACYLTAKSTIQSIPFVTRFNLGNGLKYYKNGQATFDSKWFNLGIQDYMPTWRFWITNRNDTVDADILPQLAQAELSWDEAYTGGSSLRLYGKTDFSRIKLFKTMLPSQPSYLLSATYKLKGGVETHAKLFVALKHDVANYKEIDIPAAKSSDQWTTFTTTLDKLGLAANDTIAMMGIVLENTPEDYQMYVGEMALRNPNQTFNTVKPTIKDIEVMRGWYNSVDFKLRYASKEETGEAKTYNDEVGTWYYEIYMQQQGEQPQLLTSTESWAAYVIGAPLSATSSRKCRFGVRAVSPDGENGSDISWSDYQDIECNAHVSELTIDRTIIKPNETFTVGYKDMFMPAAKSWKILNAATQEVVAQADDAMNISTALSQEGVYDVVVVNSDSSSFVSRGFISVTPEATGAMPKVMAISANTAQAKAGDNVSYTYTARKSDGKVSRGCTITDPDMLSIPAKTLEGTAFSIGIWFKADSWQHDKEGTNLISKNTIADSWPYSNWGDLWVQVRPQFTDDKTKINHQANEVSFNTIGFTDMDNPNGEMISTGYSIVPGVWNHIVVSQDEDKYQVIYLNGRCVAGPVYVPNSTRREKLAVSDSRINADVAANIYIGGSGTYKAAFNGVVDEVQVWDKPLFEEDVARAMKGYSDDEVPEHLLGYYTFEEINDKGMFPNHGTLKDCDASMVRIVNSGGEDTSTASYADQSASNNLPGYPGITGSLNVDNTASWQLGSATDASLIEEHGNTATVSYRFGGKKSVTLSLTNLWGTDQLTEQDIVEIDGPSGINNVSDSQFSVYPNPFVESVNLRFAQGGHYDICIFAETGTMMQSVGIDAKAGEIENVAVNAPAGLYIMKVIQNGQLYKTIKVVKR